MFDEKILDGKSFDELVDALEYIVEKIEEVEDETPEGEKDPRFDPLCFIANKIVVRMNSIVRESDDTEPELLARWKETVRSYEEGYEQYTNKPLEEDTLPN